MNAKQYNKYAMSRTVCGLLVKSTEVTRDITALPVPLSELGRYNGEIGALAAVQSQPTTGTVIDRDAAVEAAAHLALVIGGKVMSYADANNLGELAGKVKLTATDFRRGRNIERVQLAQSVHDTAQPLLSELASYGVTAEGLEELGAKIATATVALNVPRTMTAAKKAATQRLEVVFHQVDRLLENQIDPLLTPLMKTNPEWYAKYRAARIIIDYPGGRGGGAEGHSAAATPAILASPAELGTQNSKRET